MKILRPSHLNQVLCGVLDSSSLWFRWGRFPALCTLILLGSQHTDAADRTWDGGSTANGSWGTDTNWDKNRTAPGSTSSTTSGDVATFNAAIANTWGLVGSPIVIDAGRNIGGINFEGAAGNYHIGTTTGNSLLLSSGGTIEILSSLSATNAIETINAPLIIQGASGTYTIANNSANGSGAGAGTLNIGGSISGGAAGATVLTLNGSNTNANTISGIISNGTATTMAITKSGTGTWVLTGANTYTGLTTVSAGALHLNTTGGQAIAGNLTVSGGTAKLLQANQINSTKNLVVSSGTFDIQGFNQTVANVQLSNGSIIGSGGTLTSSNAYDMRAGTVSAILGGSVALNKTTTGTVILSGANTYTGLTTVSAGVMNIQNSAALGGTSNGTVVVSGAALQIQGGITTAAEALTLSGTGVSSTGVLRNISGDNNYAGLVSLGAASRINSDAGTLTLGNTGTITGATFGLSVGGAGNTDIHGIIGTTSGTLTKDGNGTLTLSGANTYTGLTTVSAGVVNIQNATALGGTTNGTTVTSGAAIQIQGGITTAAEALTLSGTGISSTGALRNISGDNNYAGLVRLGAASRINTDAGTLTLSNTGTITGATFGLSVGGAGNTAIHGIIGTTSGTLTKDGTGTLTLSRANTYTGLTTVSAGVLNIQNAAALGGTTNRTVVTSGAALQIQGGITTAAEALTINGTGINFDGALRNILADNIYKGTVTLGSVSRINSDSGTLTLDVNSGSAITGTFNLSIGGAGNVTIADPITTGTGTLTKDGSGTLTLSGASTYTGGTTLTSGSLIINNAGVAGTSGALGNGGTFTINGGTVDTVAAGITNARVNPINLGNNFAFGGTGNLNLGTGTITNAGNRTITLDGTGKTLTLGGVMTNSTGAAQTTTVNGPGNTLSLGGYALSNSATSYTNVITGTANVTITGVVSNGGTSTASGLTYSGSGTLTLGGANTYGGVTTISGGDVRVQNNTSLGTTAGGTTVASGAAIQINGTGLLVAEALTSLIGDGGGTGALQNLANNNTWSGAITLGTGGARINSDGGTLTLTGGITGAGNALSLGGAGNVTVSTTAIAGTNTTLTKDGAGTLTLSAANTYTGLTTVSAGTLTYGVTNALGSGDVTVAGGTLNLATFSSTVGAVTLSSGSITGTTGVLTGTSYSLTNSGTVSAILAGDATVSLTKTGAGTATLSKANTYTGGTIVSGGTLTLDYTTVGSKLADTGVLTLNGGTLNLANGATSHTEIVGSTTIGAGSSSVTRSSGTSVLRLGAITRNAGGTVNFGAPSIAQTNTTNTNGILGTWATVGGTAFAINSTNAANGPITAFSAYNQTITRLTGTKSITNTPANSNVVITEGSGAAGNNTLAATPTTINTLTNSATGGASTIAITGAQTLRVNGILNATGSGAMNIGDTANVGTVTANAAGGELVLNNFSTNTLTVNSVIANNTTASSLTVAGSGTTILTGANSYTGTTTISDGMLQVGNGSTTGSLSASSAISVSGDSVLVFNRSDTLTQGTVISGTGSVTQAGSGTLALNGTNTYSGGTSVSNGTLLVGNNAALGSGAVNLGATSGSNNAAIMLDAADRALQTNITVRNTTSGTLTLGGTNTTGTSSYDSSITLGSTVNTGKSVTLSAAAGGTVAFNGSILKNGTDTTAGVNAVNSTGSGNATIVLGGNNTYAGGTTINPNVTLVSPATNASINTLGTGTVTLLGGTLSLQGKTSFGQAVNQTQGSTGWNSDVILATTDLSTSTPTWGGTVSFDNGTSSTGAAYIANGYGAPGNVGLLSTAFNSRISNTVVGKTGGAINSSFQLQPFTGNNALVMSSTTPSATLTLATAKQTAYHDISILASSAGITERNPIPTVTLHFSDGSSVSTTIIAYDWYLLTAGQEATRDPYQALPNRVSRWSLAESPGAGTVDPQGANFGMYETDIDLSNINGVNYSGKTLTSLTFHDDLGQSANTYEAVFAVSGAVNTLNATQTYANNVAVTTNSAIDISGSLAATMGTLSIGSQTLSVTSADSTHNPYSLTLGASTLSGNPTFDVANNGSGAGTLILGALNDDGTARTITKQGAGSLTLNTAATSLGNGTALNITDGTVNSNQAIALGNLAAVSVSSGATFNAAVSQTIGSLTGAGSTTLGANTLTVGSSNNLSSTFSGVISGSGGSLVKAASGTLTLTGANTYSGTTTVSAGTLIVNNSSGSGTGTSAVSVASGAILAGNGTLGGDTSVQAGGIHAPGTGVGIEKFSSNLTYQDSSIFSWELDRTQTQTRGIGYDAVNVSGTLAGLDGADAGTSLNAVFRIVIGDSAFNQPFWSTNHTWTDIFTDAGGSSVKPNWADIFGGGFQYYKTDGTQLGVPGAQGAFSISGNTLYWSTGSGGEFVPEPTTALAALLLAAGLLRRQRSVLA
jgi:fibronectin-binding autotransporter adhesin